MGTNVKIDDDLHPLLHEHAKRNGGGSKSEIASRAIREYLARKSDPDSTDEEEDDQPVAPVKIVIPSSTLYLGYDHEKFRELLEASEKLPFDLDVLNTMTFGGIHRKTLNVLVSILNGGKSLFMCHLAAAYLRKGFKVVYFTGE